ncbi:hypothetical protein PLICRDRAFT_259199 [Plicaturopsis crispa FD-325 SS-3]|nr:hypothetical protein PLICRDRAFT_259199 [Plicaturopsis crispa FD-325 SS-3]
MRSFTFAATVAALALTASASSVVPHTLMKRDAHPFTLVNKCGNAINAVVADTKCGYSPRCDDASAYSGAQPGTIAAGASASITIDNAWVGRIFAQNGNCGAKGEDCTISEFNLDTGSQYTAQAYDISNIQGFTQSTSLGAAGCATSTCTSASCACTDAYPVGDTTGCGDDAPVKACGPGAIAFTGTSMFFFLSKLGR